MGAGFGMGAGLGIGPAITAAEAIKSPKAMAIILGSVVVEENETENTTEGGLI